MTTELFRPEVVQHRRQRLVGEIVLVQPHGYATLLGIVFAILAALAALLLYGEFDRTERISGYLRPAGGFVDVPAIRSGVVENLFVEEGGLVEAGSPLMTVEAETYLLSGDATSVRQLQALTDQLAEIDAALRRNTEQQELNRIRSEQREVRLRTRLQHLSRQLLLQREIVVNAQEQVDVLAKLAATGQATARELRLFQNQLLSANKAVSAIEGEIADLDSELDGNFELERERALELQRERSDLALQRPAIERIMVEISGDESTVIKAPVAGRVTAVQTRPGQSVEINQPLMAILPRGRPLEAELLVPARSIGRLREGLPVKVRYTAFPHRRYGVYDGRVSRVARSPVAPSEKLLMRADQLEPVYLVLVKLQDQSVNGDGKSYKLQAGMTLDADVIIQREPLWRVMFDSFIAES